MKTIKIAYHKQAAEHLIGLSEIRAAAVRGDKTPLCSLWLYHASKNYIKQNILNN